MRKPKRERHRPHFVISSIEGQRHTPPAEDISIEDLARMGHEVDKYLASERSEAPK